MSIIITKNKTFWDAKFTCDKCKHVENCPAGGSREAVSATVDQLREEGWYIPGGDDYTGPYILESIYPKVLCKNCIEEFLKGLRGD